MRHRPPHVSVPVTDGVKRVLSVAVAQGFAADLSRAGWDSHRRTAFLQQYRCRGLVLSHLERTLAALPIIR